MGDDEKLTHEKTECRARAGSMGIGQRPSSGIGRLYLEGGTGIEPCRSHFLYIEQIRCYTR